ncbi:hypothetical protein AVEN_148884-1 [Araneus ventricosus]|uniref:Uncharacterized protein n=1 Tax=Araneus ventricosus TaxID=182803 RepID=A0A4Y2DLJ8_ARAVE|nr:hypothetical protein AVEN_148884-1 [Araneus ventricosus]
MKKRKVNDTAAVPAGSRRHHPQGSITLITKVCPYVVPTRRKVHLCGTEGTNNSSGEILPVRRVGEKSVESNSYLKKAKLNNCDNMQALIDTGSSCCLLKISVAQKLKLKRERAVNKIYGFGNQKMPALTSIGRIKADIEVDNVKAESISIYVVPDDAQSVDHIGRTWLDLPDIPYTKMGKRVHIGYREDELFRNFPIDEKVNRVCLKVSDWFKIVVFDENIKKNFMT